PLLGKSHGDRFSRSAGSFGDPRLPVVEPERDSHGHEDPEDGPGAVERPPYALGEAVAVQPDAEVVHPPPTEGGDDGEDEAVHVDADLADPAGHAPVEDHEGPEADHEGAVLLRVPAPEAAPAVVRPDPA